MIGAVAYIECSAKTQQVKYYYSFYLLWLLLAPNFYILSIINNFTLFALNFQNVKAVFDTAIKVVLRPQKMKKKLQQWRGCIFLWWLIFATTWYLYTTLSVPFDMARLYILILIHWVYMSQVSWDGGIQYRISNYFSPSLHLTLFFPSTFWQFMI